MQMKGRASEQSRSLNSPSGPAAPQSLPVPVLSGCPIIQLMLEVETLVPSDHFHCTESLYRPIHAGQEYGTNDANWSFSV